MGPKKPEPLNTKDRKEQLRGFKRYLSKEIIEDTWTAGDQAYLEFWTNEKILHIAQLEDMLEKTSQENGDLRAKLKQTEDRFGQQIAELREKVNEKCEDIARMTEDNHRFLENRGSDLNTFDATLHEEEQKFVNMREKLTTEVKQLNSKLKNMEEFRYQRDGLIARYQAQLKHLQELEESAASIVTDYQKLDLVNKDRMGQELKDRLLKLSIEFQEASQTETTRSLIRENIAINNELGGHIGSWQTLYDQNKILKRQRYQMRHELRTEESLKERSLALNVLQAQVLERLAFEHQKLDGFHDEIETLQRLKKTLGEKFEGTSKEAREAEHEVKLLAQARHDLETQVTELDHDYRVILKVIQEEEITLKKALLHVAEGQEMRLRRARNRLSADQLRLKLSDIIKELRTLFKEDSPKQMSSPRIFTTGSLATLYDPEYAVKYWRGHGVTIDQPRETKKEDKAGSEGKKDDDDDSSDSV